MQVTITPTTERYSSIAGLPLVLPSWAEELAGAFADEGVAVAVGSADRVVDQDRSVELWLPLIEVGGSLGVGVAGGLIANALDRFVRGRRVEPKIIHLRVSCRGEENRDLVELEGTPDDVASALRAMSG